MGWGGGEGRALGEGIVIRVVLGLGDGAGDGEEGGVRGGEGGGDTAAILPGTWYKLISVCLYRHTSKHLGKRLVLESLDCKAPLRSQRPHSEDAFLNPPLKEPSRRLSLRSLLSFFAFFLFFGTAPTLTSTQNLHHCFKINIPFPRTD